MAQAISSLCDSIAVRLSQTPVSSTHLLVSWIYEGRVAVFEYVINGRPISFDVSGVVGGNVKIEVFSRNDPSINRHFVTMKFRETENKHFLVAEFDDNMSEDVEISRISDVISATIARIAEIGRHPGDEILLKCVGALSPLIIVDVGANYLSEPPYAALLHAGLCKIIGFEPQREAFEKLQDLKKENETYFPYAVGEPGVLDLNIYSSSGFTSAYKIDERTINVAKNWSGGTRFIEHASIECVALDDVAELPPFDVLKIDVQGGELNVFRNARRCLASAVCIITEVGFFPLYENAPTFADVHNELLGQGFLLHKFLHLTHADISQSCKASMRGIGGSSQIIDGDAVYLRDYRNFNALSAEMLKKYALLAHFVFDSRDLVLRMLESLAERGKAPEDMVGQYADSLR